MEYQDVSWSRKRKKFILIVLVGFAVIYIGIFGKIAADKIENWKKGEDPKSSTFYLHIGQSKSEIIGHINEPNETDVVVDARYGKIERCQWGSERVGTMVVIYFKDDRVIRFETKGKVK